MADIQTEQRCETRSVEVAAMLVMKSIRLRVCLGVEFQ